MLWNHGVGFLVEGEEDEEEKEEEEDGMEERRNESFPDWLGRGVSTTEDEDEDDDDKVVGEEGVEEVLELLVVLGCTVVEDTMGGLYLFISSTE